MKEITFFNCINFFLYTFDFIFQAAELAGWLPTDADAYPRATHVGFGLVLGEDGKRFRTRSSEVVRLADLLDEANTRMLEQAKEKQEERLKRGMETIEWIIKIDIPL